MSERRAVLFVNGEIPDPARARLLLAEDDVHIAVDGGVRHALALDCVPSVLIGDLDSTPAAVLKKPHLAETRILRFSPDKDQTDLELALDYSVAENFSRILILGGLGGRTDHTLANLSLLLRADLRPRDVRFDDGREEIRMIFRKVDIMGNAGDTVSLLPFGIDARAVRTEGLQYPLRGETLLASRSRGVSNRLTGARAVISISKGQLLCIHTRS
jgi:thiamine pyrophosphokinase